MKKLLLIIALFAFASLAHAQTACTGGAQCVQTETASGATGADVVAPTWTNTAGNSLDVTAWVACTSTNPNVPFVFIVNSGTPNEDSNGNVWNGGVVSQFAFTSTTRALYHFWTEAPINAGSNSITFKNGTTDCKILGSILTEYSGWHPYNPGEYVKNVAFMPFSVPDTNTTFPINANASYRGLNPVDLTYFCGINEGTGGTWTPNSGWALVNSMSASGFQMACYDGTTGTAPSTISLNNSGSGFTQALGLWEEFNRVVPPTFPYTLANYTQSVLASSVSQTFSHAAGDLVFIQIAMSNPPLSSTLTDPSGCGTWYPYTGPEFTADNIAPYAIYVQYFPTSGSCTVTETPTPSQSSNTAMGILVISGLPVYSIEGIVAPNANTPFGVGTLTAVTTEPYDLGIILGALNNGNSGGHGSGVTIPGYSPQGFAVLTGGVVMGQWAASIAPVGEQTVTASPFNTGTGAIYTFIPLRITIPSEGFRQIMSATGGVSTSVTNISGTMIYPSAAGDKIQLKTFNANYEFNYAITSAALGTPYQHNTYGDGPLLVLSNFDVASTTSTPPTINYSISPSTDSLDMVAIEFAGATSTGYLANTTSFATPAVTSVTLGPLSIRQPSDYYLTSFSNSHVFHNDTDSEFSATAGFVSRAWLPFNNQLNQVWDQMVTGPAAPSNTITQGSRNLIAGGSLSAFKMGAAYTDPQIVASAEYFPSRSNSTLSRINEPTAGCNIFFSQSADTGSSGWTPPTTSPSLPTPTTLLGGGSGDLQVLYEYDNVPAGSIDFTTSNVGLGPNEALQEKVCNAGSSVSCTAPALFTASGNSVTGSTTTSSGCPFVLGFAQANGAGTGSYVTDSSADNYVLNPFGFGDNITLQGYNFVANSFGTTTLTANGTAGPTSMDLMLVNLPGASPPASEGGTVMGGNAAASGNGVQ